MSVVKFTQPAGYYNLQSFYDFLIANKEGTFLEDAVLTKDTESTYVAENNHYISFNIGDGTVTIRTAKDVDDNYPLVSFTIQSGVSTGISRDMSSSSYKYFMLNSALLCSNGLIMKIAFVPGSGSETTYSYLVLGVDSGGSIVLIRPNGANDYNMRTEQTYYVAASYDSSTLIKLGALPQFNSDLTSIAPITLLSDDNTLFVDGAFIASSTQLSSLGLQTVSIGGVLYITNGIIYIRD